MSEQPPDRTAIRERYLALLPTLRTIAREHGYALGVHGSETRDFDLIAVPWVADASDPKTLIHALAVMVQGTVQWAREPMAKPHGRQGWVIYLVGPSVGVKGSELELHPPYLDISVIPAPFGDAHAH